MTNANDNARFPHLAALLRLPETEPEFETFDGSELTSAAAALIPGATVSANDPESWNFTVDSATVTVQDCHAGLYSVRLPGDLIEAQGSADISNTPTLAASARILATTVARILNLRT